MARKHDIDDINLEVTDVHFFYNEETKLFSKSTTDRMLFNGIELTKHLEGIVHKYLNALLGQ